MCTKTLCSLDTGYHADTVEWCPVGGFESYLVCGTYQLLEKSEGAEENPPSSPDHEKSLCSSSSVRVGNVQLYYLNETLGRLDKLQCFETGGVLDTKWLPSLVNGYPVLGGVTSKGELKIFFLKEKKLSENTSYTTSPGKLCLSLDWSPKAENSLVTISDSAGQISVCQFGEGTSDLCQILQWTGHQYEAWITAFDVSNSSVVYSGGDDCLFRGWDTRTDCHKPSFTSKRHDMGVSSIQCNICHEHIMATGSYDENIHVWDTRSMRQPLCSSRPGGGVWRIKWHPVHGNTMLTACMYEGFHILNFSNRNGDQYLKKSVSYKKQASLAYGADWCRNKTLALTELHKQTVQQSEENSEFKDSQTFECNTDLVATCSFYDHALNLWQVSNL